MIITRRARQEEFEKIVAFYRDNDYRATIDSADIFVVAENEGALCGVVRICEEQDVLILRGMRFCEGVRRQGIGTHLLETVEALIGKRECFCIPHRYPGPFYGHIGFVEIEEKEAPLFLRERAATYRSAYGLDVILMRRPA
jgi:N-acetylglutamate synthase-like GNAT family acetyltransferase